MKNRSKDNTIKTLRKEGKFLLAKNFIKAEAFCALVFTLILRGAYKGHLLDVQQHNGAPVLGEFNMLHEVMTAVSVSLIFGLIVLGLTMAYIAICHKHFFVEVPVEEDDESEEE